MGTQQNENGGHCTSYGVEIDYSIKQCPSAQYLLPEQGRPTS